MVKFSFLALASAVATVSAAKSGPVKKHINLGNRNLRRGDAATEALLKKATPYKGKRGAKKIANRRAEEDAEEEEFEITGAYSLQFSECIDIKTVDEDLFDEDIVGYVQSGQIVAAKSYVLFHVCQDDTCYIDAEDDLYLVDLPTYLTNIAQYHANKRNDFCEQCERFDEYCNPEEEEEEAAEEEAEDEEAEGEEDAEEEDEGEGEEDEGEDEGEGEDEDAEEEGDERKLKKNKRKLKKNKKLTKKARKDITRKLADKNYIDCDKCSAYECFEDEDEMDDGQQRRDELDEEVSEWIAGLAECQETGTQWGDLDLYVGAMCSPHGDGVELAVFANDECTWYTNQKSFQSEYNPYNDDNGNNVNYLMYAEDFIKSAFSDVTPCAQTEYDDPDEDDDNANDDEEEQNEASEYCQAIMEEEVVSFSNCAADEDAEEEEADDALANYGWFTYDMKDADDINEVCVALNAMESADYSHVYDEESSGTWYKRNKKGSIVYANEKEGLSGGAIGMIVLVALGVIGAAGFVMMKSKKQAVETDYQGGEMS